MASLIPASPLVLLLLVSTLASAVNGWVLVHKLCVLMEFSERTYIAVHS